MANDKSNKVTIIIIFIIVITALGLRLYGLNKYDLWYDEYCTDGYSFEYHRIRAEWCGVSVPAYFLDCAMKDYHPPFYYLLVYAYSFFFGVGKSLRILSVIFSMLSLGAFYKLSRLFLRRHECLYALFILACNPFHIWYAQEARVYAMAGFFAIVAFYLYMKALKINTLLYWALFSISSVFALYTSPYFSLFLLISGVFLFFKNNQQYARKWIVSMIVILMICFPIIYKYMHQFKNVDNDFFWVPVLSFKTLCITFVVFSLG
ncbi:MAG: glycosyltransferase family 39 protein, partial [Candidatus Omnitrophica bacterium]|nr:glycosyltransferase family 39 protein [Candidatus Omnitrophota bacterium]